MDHAHRRLEHLAHPVGCHNLEILTFAPARGTVGVEVVEQSAGLVLLHVEAGEAQQSAVRIAGIDDARAHEHTLAVFGGLHLELVHIEPKLVETIHALSIFHISFGEKLSVSVSALHSEW